MLVSRSMCHYGWKFTISYLRMSINGLRTMVEFPDIDSGIDFVSGTGIIFSMDGIIDIGGLSSLFRVSSFSSSGWLEKKQGILL